MDRMDSTFYQRYRFIIFAIAIILFPLIVIGARQARQTSENRVTDWLPDQFPETKTFYWFFEQFGSDELLMISWEGCDINDAESRQHLEQLATALTAPEVREDGTQHGPWFREVLTGPEAVSQFMDVPLRMTRNEALVRLEGWLVEQGARRKIAESLAAQRAARPNEPLSSYKLPAVQTCAVALVSDAGRADREAAVAYVYDVIERRIPTVGNHVHVAGSTIESVAINEVSSTSLPRLQFVSLLIVFGLMYASFRHFGMSLIVFVIAIFCQQMALAVMFVSGSRLDSVGLMVPTLVYVLVISAAVHLINYYRDAIKEQPERIELAEMRAVQFAWRPCLLAAVTTALGLISLLVSVLVPIRKFGLFAAIGVMLGTGVLFCLGPALLAQFPARRLKTSRSWVEEHIQRGWGTVSALITRYHLGVAVFGLILIVVTGYGVARIQPTARLHNLFRDDAKVIKDYAWLEEHIGSLVPVEVVIHIPQSSEATALERVLLVASINRHVRNVEGIDVTIRATNFMPRLPVSTGGARQVANRSMMEQVLSTQRDKLVELRVLQENEEEQLWRITARVKASDPSIDYGEVLAALEAELDPVLNAIRGQDVDELERLECVLVKAIPEERLEQFSDADVTVCGSIPLVHKAQEQLLTDLFTSFLTAFIVIAIAMMVLLRSVPAGMISMIPNLLPAVVVFGVMGLAGVEIEIGSMMTASAALGIAVDDTLHFVTWFRRGVEDGMSRTEAVRFSYERCGTAMVQTSLICGIGMFVFAMSPFVPIARFAWLMAAMLAAALLADLIVLPAILIGPLGTFFTPKRIKETAPVSRQVSEVGG